MFHELARNTRGLLIALVVSVLVLDKVIAQAPDAPPPTPPSPAKEKPAAPAGVTALARRRSSTKALAP